MTARFALRCLLLIKVRYLKTNDLIFVFKQNFLTFKIIWREDSKFFLDIYMNIC